MHSRLNPASRANSGASNDSVGPSTDVLSRAQQAFAANQAAQAAAAAAGGAAAGAGNGGAGRFGAGHFIPSSALGATVERSSHSLPHGAAPPLGPPPALRGIPPSAALGGAGGLSATLGAPGQSAALPSGLDSSTHVLPWDQGGLAPTVKRPHGGSLTVLPGSGGVDRGSPGGSAGARLVGSGAGETPLSATSHWSAAGGNVSSDSHSPAVSRGVSSRLKKGSKAPEGSVGEGRREVRGGSTDGGRCAGVRSMRRSAVTPCASPRRSRPRWRASSACYGARRARMRPWRSPDLRRGACGAPAPCDVSAGIGSL